MYLPAVGVVFLKDWSVKVLHFGILALVWDVELFEDQLDLPWVGAAGGAKELDRLERHDCAMLLWSLIVN